MKHEGSVHRQQVKLQNDAFADGVCHAIDEVRAIAEAARLGGDAAGADAANRLADRLERNLFGVGGEDRWLTTSRVRRGARCATLYCRFLPRNG